MTPSFDLSTKQNKTKQKPREKFQFCKYDKIPMKSKHSDLKWLISMLWINMAKLNCIMHVAKDILKLQSFCETSMQWDYLWFLYTMEKRSSNFTARFTSKIHSGKCEFDIEMAVVPLLLPSSLVVRRIIEAFKIQQRFHTCCPMCEKVNSQNKILIFSRWLHCSISQQNKYKTKQKPCGIFLFYKYDKDFL